MVPKSIAHGEWSAPWHERGEQLALTIGDTAPDFEAQTSEGPIRFHELQAGISAGDQDQLNVVAHRLKLRGR